MKGIYLTEEGKQEIEARIAKIKIELKSSEEMDEYGIGSIYAALDVYEKILSSAIILPVEESWDNIDDKIINAVINNEVFNKPYHETEYPNGVIIQLKNKDANNSRISG